MNLTKLFQVILFILPLSVHGQYIYEVDASLLNVRAGRGIEYEKVIGVPRGEIVEVIEIVDDWAEIKTKEGIKGYVAFEYLKPQGHTEEEEEEEEKNKDYNNSSEDEDEYMRIILITAFLLYTFYSLFLKGPSTNKSSKKSSPKKKSQKQSPKKHIISRVKVDGNYLETIDEKGKRIKRAYNNGDFLGNSSQIVVVQDGNYIEVLDEDLKKISRSYHKFDRFLSTSGDTFSIQDGNYAETLDAKGNRISRRYSK